ILMHTINAFYKASSSIQIILVLPPQDIEFWKDMCKRYLFNVPVLVAEGGNTRYSSVKNGLSLITTENSIIAVHDGVRPLVTTDLILRSYKEAKLKGSAVPSIDLKDSIRMVKDGKSKSVDRAGY